MVLLIWPATSAKIICIVLGIIVLAHGIFRIVGYFMKDDFGIPDRFDLALGIFNILLGCYALFCTRQMLTLLPLLLGILIIIESIFKVQALIDLKRVGYQNWWIDLILTILTIAIGVILIIDPFSGLALTIFIGVSLIFDGLINLWTVLYLSSVIKRLGGGSW